MMFEQRNMNTQKAFNALFSTGKKKAPDDNELAEMNPISSTRKSFFNKNTPEGLIGRPESKSKEVVIFSKKSVEESVNDVATL